MEGRFVAFRRGGGEYTNSVSPLIVLPDVEGRELVDSHVIRVNSLTKT